MTDSFIKDEWDGRERREGTLNAILVSLGEVKSSVEGTSVWLRDVAGKQVAHESRIEKLEQWKAFVYGSMAVILTFLVPIALMMVHEYMAAK